MTLLAGNINKLQCIFSYKLQFQFNELSYFGDKYDKPTDILCYCIKLKGKHSVLRLLNPNRETIHDLLIINIRKILFYIGRPLDSFII